MSMSNSSAADAPRIDGGPQFTRSRTMMLLVVLGLVGLALAGML
jgi:hypothetical protein